MNRNGFELSDKQLKILIFFCVSLFLIYIIYVEFKRSNMNSSKDYLSSVINEEYQGIVSYKDYDKSNHNNPTLYFKDKKQVIINGDFWAQIKTGDSLVKRKGETIISVYRNNHKFILDNKDFINKLKKINNY